MSPEDFSHRLHLVNERIADLVASEAPPAQTLEDLRVALEELRVADEELRQQNEELIAAQVQLDIERQRYQELFELAPDAYLVTDSFGIILEANRSASRLLGIAPELLPGKALANYIAADDRARFRSLLGNPDRAPGAHSGSFQLRTRQVNRLYGELTYSIVWGKQGEPSGFRWMVRDLTRQERLAHHNTVLKSRIAARTADLQAAQQVSRDLLHREQAARHAAETSEARSLHVQKLESIGVLAGGIAHDFNNLLHVVLGNADIALAQLPRRSPAREPLEEVIRATLRAADLTRQMLAYSGKGAFVVRHLDLSSEVRDMGTLLRTAISKQASLVWELASDLPAVNADATQIRQIVMNLITNASDALHDQAGTIRLRTGIIGREELNDAQFGDPAEDAETSAAAPAQLVFLEVSDTGAGMSPDTLQRIFDPFFSTKFSGRGLGLAAVMGIVRSHRGFIRIQTEEGRGTTFRVLFPAVDGTSRKADPPPAAQSEWHGSGTALVVDDEEGVRDVAALMLAEVGFESLTAIDGRDAMEIMERVGDNLTVVLLDLSMPRMGGQETFRRLRQARPDLPIIMMSGYTSQTVGPQLQDAPSGPSGFLQKPFLAEELVHVLRAVLESTTEPTTSAG